jgi:protein TonB
VALPKNPKYDLRLHYQRVWETGLIIALAILIISFKFFPEVKKQVVKQEGPQELVQVEDVEHTKQETAPPPPPKPPIPIEAPSDEVLDDVEIESTDLNEQADVPPPPPPPKVEKKEEEPVFFVAVEQQPTPIGGIQGIQKRIVYPEIAKRAGVQGRVYVRAYVDENGVVRKAEVVKGIGAGCDEAAVKAVMATRFKPGRQRGKPVKVQVMVPILFKLR